MSPKKNFLYHLKSNFWIVGVIVFLMAFSSKLQAIADAPASVQKTAETVDRLANSLERYVAVQEEERKFTDWRLNQLEKGRNA